MSHSIIILLKSQICHEDTLLLMERANIDIWRKQYDKSKKNISIQTCTVLQIWHTEILSLFNLKLLLKSIEQ